MPAYRGEADLTARATATALLAGEAPVPSGIEAEPVASPVASVPVPTQPPILPGVDEGMDTFDRAVLTRAFRSSDVEEDRRELSRYLAQMVGDPDDLLRAIMRALYKQESLTETPAVFAARAGALIADPNSYGGLRGKTGLFASRSAKEERAQALAAVPEANAWIGHLKTTFDHQVASGRQWESARRAAMQIPIPGLSAGTRAALLMLDTYSV